MSESDLYELRTYVARPGTLDVLLERWETHFQHIYPDYHVVLGYFVATASDDDDPRGLSLLMQHDHRKAVDDSMAALIASDRMNQVGGPPGTSYVDHWERIFLHPLAVAGLDPARAPDEASGGYEFRTLVATADGLETMLERWKSAHARAGDNSIVAAFVSQPEKYEPDGISLIRTNAADAVAPTGGPLDVDLDGTVERVARTVLTPTSYSPMR